jgi:hypothetical protein
MVRLLLRRMQYMGDEGLNSKLAQTLHRRRYTQHQRFADFVWVS